MIAFINTLVISALLGTTPAPTTPNAPKELSFGASAYVTVQNKIRVAVEKSAAEPVTVLLRDKQNKVLFQETITKKSKSYAASLDVSSLTDGAYELEFKSAEGSIRKQLQVATPQQATPARQVVMNPAE